jgi:hypothetical protein
VPRGAPPAPYDPTPALLAAQAPTAVSKYDIAQDVLEGRWLPLATADPLEVPSVPALIYTLQDLPGSSSGSSSSVAGPLNGAVLGGTPGTDMPNCVAAVEVGAPAESALDA